MSNFFEDDFGRFFRHRASSRSPPRDSGTDGGTGMVSAVGTTTILPIADRSPARAIPLQNAYSDRVDQYDTISVHTAISSQNEQSVQNGAISPRGYGYGSLAGAAQGDSTDSLMELSRAARRVDESHPTLPQTRVCVFGLFKHVFKHVSTPLCLNMFNTTRDN